MKSQFNEAFSKIDGLKQWFEEQQFVTSSKGGSEIHLHSHQGHSHSKTPSIHKTPQRIPTLQPSLKQSTPMISPPQTPPQKDCNNPIIILPHNSESYSQKCPWIILKTHLPHFKEKEIRKQRYFLNKYGGHMVSIQPWMSP